MARRDQAPAPAGEKRDETGRPTPRAGDPLARPRLVALAAAALVLFPMLAKSGIWDPYELDAADLARRIAVRVFGASGLELPGAANGLPSLSDLKMGELPFTSMALGFKVFGLHDWTGRLPLAIWGLAGAAVLFEFLARLVDRRAGVYGVIALVTMPLYFMQARTMLGDIVTMSATTMAFCGLAGAMLDTRGSARARAAWLAVGALGLASGFLSRGLILGVAVPALSVGATWIVLREARADDDERDSRDTVGAVALAVGMLALGFGLRAFLRATPDAPLSRLLGFALLRKPPTASTFDLVIRQLGHALFPWSAFLPFAFGRVLRAPVEAEPEARDRETGVRVALLVGAAVAYGAYALVAPRTGPLAFSAPALLAGLAAITILDLERGAPPSRPLVLGCAVLGAVLLADILREPSRALAAFVVDKPQFPKSFEAAGHRRMLIAFALFIGLTGLAWIEKDPGHEPPAARARHTKLRAVVDDLVSSYRAGLRELGDIWAGNLLFGLVVVEAALVGFGAMVFVGRRVGWAPVDRLPKMVADIGVNLWWAIPLVVLSGPGAFAVLLRAFRALLVKTRLSRASFTAIAALLAGLVQSFWYYPALAAQLSPKEAFDAYAHLRHPGEPLALLSVRSRAAAYYAGGEAPSFTDASRAFAWLTQNKDQRRWLLVKADDLPRMNHLYRGQTSKNLPILDGRSSQILLASNILGDHVNESWLAKLVLDDPPSPALPLDVMFEDQLAAIGWEVADKRGRVVPTVVPATRYHLRIYYRVQKPITAKWKAFVHIDGFQRRFNGDHDVLDGKYPTNLWRAGDVVVDDLELQLEPNFTPGDYNVYFGFFTGDARFRVTRGEHHDNRVVAGVIHVR